MSFGTNKLRAGRFALFASALTSGSLAMSCAGDIGSPLNPSFGASENFGEPGAPGVGPIGPDGKPINIDKGAQSLNCTQPNVGATPLQRLSRAQYGNSVRDILKVTLEKGALPEDEKVGAFDGNVIVPVTDLLVDEYAAAAERVATAVLPKIEQLVSCDRAKDGDAKCSSKWISELGRRLYRRPLHAEEVTAYEGLYSAFKGKGYTQALRVIVQTMLQSPMFLYRVELTPVQKGDFTKLDPYELASRLSFFLVSSAPDDELLALAADGTLAEEDVLEAQIERLMDDARFSDTLESFHMQWLDIDKVDALSKDDAKFAAFTPELGAAMRKETASFIDYVFRKDDATLDTLLTASYSFPQAGLGKLYGTADATGEEPVELDPEQRAGLLTQPAFLASHSHYDKTSPVLRGKVVIRNVLCQDLPDPPANVDTTPPEPTANATTREMLQEHVANPACAGCHKRIDGIGLGFEAYDALGGFRTMESGKPIDSTGEVLATKGTNGSFDGVPELSRKLAQSVDVQQCVTKQWLRFALGRMEADADKCTLEKLFNEFADSGRDIRALLRSIVLSDAFRSKRVATESAP